MSISPEKFFSALKKHGIVFFTGVPDSLLKQLCLCIDYNVDNKHHIIAANEGNAVALATGYHMATGKLPLVYMQNSGLGNSVNPLLSLCDPEVYSIPLILLIGWRGEPGVADEPQHIKQGRVQLELLKAMEIDYKIIADNTTEYAEIIQNSVIMALRKNKPTALIIKKGTFDKFTPRSIKSPPPSRLMTREEALETIIGSLPKGSIVVSTTGKTSREIFEIRQKRAEDHATDFLTVGSMGHCSSIALGIALAKPKRNVFCIDGDGALIMHMGSLATIGKSAPQNYYHILINNKVHESVGGQATAMNIIAVQDLVKSNGYNYTALAGSINSLKRGFNEFLNSVGPAFLEVVVKPGSRHDLGRPTVRPIDNKKAFMGHLEK